MTTKKERAEALARMTKAELIKTVKTLDARQVKLLNEIARMKAEYNSDLRTAMDVGAALVTALPDTKGRVMAVDFDAGDGCESVTLSAKDLPRWPWEDVLNATADYTPSSGEPVKRGDV